MHLFSQWPTGMYESGTANIRSSMLQYDGLCFEHPVTKLKANEQQADPGTPAFIKVSNRTYAENGLIEGACGSWLGRRILNYEWIITLAKRGTIQAEEEEEGNKKMGFFKIYVLVDVQTLQNILHCCYCRRFLVRFLIESCRKPHAEPFDKTAGLSKRLFLFWS